MTLDPSLKVKPTYPLALEVEVIIFHAISAFSLAILYERSPCVLLFDLPLTLPLELSSEMLSFSEPQKGEVERIVSMGCLVHGKGLQANQAFSVTHFAFKFIPRAAPRRVPVPIPMQLLRCGAYRFEATWVEI